MLNREQIAAKAAAAPPVLKHIESLGGDVFIKQLSAGERIDWEMNYIGSGKVDMRTYTLGLIAQALVDGEGKPLFTIDDVAGWSREASQEVGEAAAEVNGIGAKAVAEAEGKSEAPTPDGGDGSLHGASGTSTLT